MEITLRLPGLSNTDEVIELVDIPQSDVGAPFPHLVATEQSLVLFYKLQNNETGLDQNSRGGAASPTAIVRFRDSSDHKFGGPNDEAINGHPLYKKGLRP